MNKKLSLSDILFNVKTAPIAICPGETCNSFAPPATPHSPKRGSKSRNSYPPKFSKIAMDLEKIIKGEVSAVWSKDGSFVYCEIIKHDSTTPSKHLYNGINHELKEDFADSFCYSSIPMLLWAMHDKASKFEYTRTAATRMISNMDMAARVVEPIDLGFLCESFYYDWVDELASLNGTIEFNTITESDMESIRQAARTNSVQKIDEPFNEFIGSTFSGITFDAAKNEKKDSVSSASDFFAKAKDGVFILPYNWNDEQEERIRPLISLDDYIPNASYQKMTKVAYKRLSRVIDRQNLGKTGLDAIKDDYINIIIGGRPGTGKTTTADALSATLGLPIYTAKVTRNTEEDTFEGMTKADSEGKFVVHDTAFLKAFEHGGIVVLEEFNLADPGVLQGAIGQAIEYPFILNKDGYMEIHRHPMCIIIATMNTGTQGAREPNQALTSRFPITLTMNDPTESEFLAILQKHGHKKTLCKKVYKAYSSILKYLKQTANDEEMALCVTMRHCLAALNMIDDGIVDSVREAVYDTMIGSIGLRDADTAEDVYAHAIMPLGGLD